MTDKGAERRWGGARQGAGRPRSLVALNLPPVIVAQLDEIATAEGAAIEDVVKAAILDFIERWQTARDREEP